MTTTTRKPITMKFEQATITAWDTAARAAGQSRTAWVEDACKRRLEQGDTVTPPSSPPRSSSDSLRSRLERAQTPHRVASSAESKRGIKPITKMGAK